MALKRIKVPELGYGPVSVWYCPEWEEYQVKIQGRPKATYHTPHRTDALRTAQVMRNTQGAAV